MRINPRAVQSFASTNCDTWYAASKANAKTAIVEYSFVRGAKLVGDVENRNTIYLISKNVFGSTNIRTKSD
jgi:hypothetical protein